ncbi:MAG: MoaD/ThiS family protein [Rhodothermales bacterium]|nr:MoaD/ThiS family protein [Rhodothermales bacterium]
MSTQPITTTTIRIPTPLRGYTGGQAAVPAEGATVGAALDALARRFPSVQPHLFDDAGHLRAFVNVYLGDEDIRYLHGMETPLTDGAELSLVPSIAGGA